MVFLYATCKNVEEAKKFSADIVKSRVAACVNILPATTIYRNGGGVWKTDEALMIIQTIDSKAYLVEDAVRKVASDTVPYAACFAFHRVNREYKDWLAASVA